MSSRPAHGLARLTGRNPDEGHRAATPLELLYDLTLVVAFAIAGEELAHSLSADHIVDGLLAFAFCMFAIIWAWTNNTWVASSYDTDDWGCRLGMLLQMLGVTILALGIGDLFHGIEEGELDNGVIVIGYVIMRVGMMATLLRAARSDTERRASLQTYIRILLVAQVGWVISGFLSLPFAVMVVIILALYVLEIGGVWFVENRVGSLPWHPHHVAERFGLLGIITFGEVVLGTTIAVEAVVAEADWTLDAAVLAFSGIAMVVGMWWVYFCLPHGEVLERRRELGVHWGYTHFFVYSSIAATGAGLHAVAYLLEDHSKLGTVGTTLTVAIPLAIFLATTFALFHLLLPGRDPLHVYLLAGTLALIAGAVALSATDLSIAWPILLLTLAPWVNVIGYEVHGHKEIEKRLTEIG